MATERATIEVEGARVSCDRCGAMLAEGRSPDEAESHVDGSCWTLASRDQRGRARRQREPHVLWLCSPCGEALYSKVLSDREATIRRAAGVAS